MSRFNTDPKDGLTLRIMDRTGEVILKGDRAGNRVQFPASHSLRALKREQAEMRNAETPPEKRRAHRREYEDALARAVADSSGNTGVHVRSRARRKAEGAVPAGNYAV